MKNLIDLHIANRRVHRREMACALVSRARIGLLVATLSCLSFGVKAQTGTITFVGTIVAPTCQVSTDAPSELPVHEGAADQSCGSQKDKSVRSYQLSTKPIQADSKDQVLRYFFNYVTSADNHAQQPVLMTLQYD